MTSDTPTEKRTDDSTDTNARSTMGSVDHTHPERNTTFGSVFGRGPSVAADGGEPASGGRSSSDHRSDGGEPASGRRSDGPPAPSADSGEDDVMEDVDHEAPSETGANASFERGAEHAAATGSADVDDPADVADPADVEDPVDEATDE